MRQDLAGQPAKPDEKGTIGSLRREIAATLAAAFRKSGKAGTPDLDAKLLVAAAAKIDPASLPIRDHVTADSEVVRRASAFAERRARGEPVARIVGHKEFWGLDLALAPATLVPRPDTETLVEAALAFDAGRGKGATLRILDLGTGSGAILLALLSELPAATGIGTDIVPSAAAIAAENAQRLGLSGRAMFAAGSWATMVGGAFDMVVCNPPYIPTGDIAALESEVRDHDPRRALDGGADGLAAVRAILADLPRLMAPGACAFIEIGAGQRDGVARLARAARFGVDFAADLAGIDRVAILTR